LRVAEAVVVDTNVFLSALISKDGVPAHVVRKAFAEFRPVYSRQTIKELSERLNDHKFARWIDAKDRARLLAFVIGQGSLVDPVPPVAVLPDADDDMFVALALAANAVAIVTGDKRFLAAGRIGAVAILSPRQFLDEFPPGRAGGGGTNV
jgi:putative PIN family toxin of toxin-antitoxin system